MQPPQLSEYPLEVWEAELPSPLEASRVYARAKWRACCGLHEGSLRATSGPRARVWTPLFYTKNVADGTEKYICILKYMQNVHFILIRMIKIH